MKKPCFDPSCTAEATRNLRGFRMCIEHYVEALEHSAHIDSLVVQSGKNNSEAVKQKPEFILVRVKP